VWLLVPPAFQARGQAAKAAVKPKPAAVAAAKPAVAEQTKPGVAKAGVQLPALDPVVSPQQAADEQAIRQADASFAKAYEEGNAQAVAAHFTADAEYVDESGSVFQGRAAIEESLTEFFAETTSCKLELTIDTIRFISPGVAVEDGSTAITHPDSPEPIESRYTTVHVKTDGKWLAASVRDHAPKDHRRHSAQLQQLDWLIGDWVDEGDDALIAFKCEAIDGGNFLTRSFTIQIAGQVAQSGVQRIGWDPLTGKLRTWIFDSEGGYGEGLWHRSGDNWVLKLTGVTADGESASSTSIYTLVNGHTMTWQSVDHEIAGVQLPDSEVVTVVRAAPTPQLTETP
jgi:uncharacterized protein (TIGR02246 family)